VFSCMSATATQVAWTTHMHVGGPHDPLHATHLGGPLPCMAAGENGRTKTRAWQQWPQNNYIDDYSW